MVEQVQIYLGHTLVAGLQDSAWRVAIKEAGVNTRPHSELVGAFDEAHQWVNKQTGQNAGLQASH